MLRSPRAGRGQASAVWVPAALTLVVAFALRYPSLFEPRWYGDEGIFAAIAENLRAGRMLYAEAWDNKPPGIFVTYAVTQALFGSGVMPIHAVVTVAVLATQAAVMAIAFRLYGGWHAVAAGALFSLLMCTPIIEGTLAMTETFMILPVTLGALVFVYAQRLDEARRTGWHVACGVLLSIAIAYKQVAVFDAAAIALMLWLTSIDRVRAVGALVIGVAVPQALVALLFVTMGAFGEYWYAVAGSLGLYTEIGPQVHPLARFAGYVPALVAAAWLMRRRQLGWRVDVRLFPVLWLGFAIAGSTSSSFAFPHYLQQAAPAAALVAAGMPWRFEPDRLNRWLLAAGGAAVAAIVFGQFALAFEDRRQLDPVDYYRTFVSHQWGTMSDLEYEYHFDGKAVAVRDIAAYIDEDGAGETAFAWGELPWVYEAASLRNPTRYYTSFLGELVPGAKDDIVDDLYGDPPVYLIIGGDAYAPFGELEKLVEAEYSLLRAQGDWRLYRLSEASGALEPEPGDAQGERSR
jgi:4-amino-4-deoxy-L-arabinose transferase-like glycosyltransferase